LPWYSDGTDGNPYGTPYIDMVRFPDMKGMVKKAHGMGLRAGWYMGNYQCSGANSRSKDQAPWDMDKLVAGSVAAIKVSKLQVQQLIQIHAITDCCLTLSALGSQTLGLRLR
jgi:hypothetical protein